MGEAGTHERLDADDEVLAASPRSFGFLFAVVFAIVAAAPLWRGEPLRLWSALVAAALLLVAAVAPALLSPFSAGWQRLGLLLHHVINPLVMGALFYGAVTPFGLVMRLFGKGLTRRLGPDRAATTYWVSREGSTPSSMKRQF